MKIGFVVNPVSGMGGTVGLKGTDGPEVLREALSRGAQRVAPARAVIALREIKKRGLDLEFISADGEMGQNELQEAGMEGRSVYTPPVTMTSPDDTINAAKAFAAEGVDLILFAGGDGTARDLLHAVDTSVPILGVPAGVKMHSSVFAVTPEKAADAVSAFSETGMLLEGEVMDIDEDLFRKGIVQARLYGVAKVPDDSSSLQVTKDAYHSGTAEEEAEELGKYLAENMDPGMYYILGPGTTTAAIARNLGAKKTILGVDMVLDGRTVLEDASERDLLGLLAEGRQAKIIVSPIGAQGFFFGRGNQQISAAVLRRVGVQNVVVVATPTKLRGTPVLRVDTGDASLDASFRGRVRVVTGYGRRRLVQVV